MSKKENGPAEAEKGSAKDEKSPVEAESGPVKDEKGPVEAEGGPVKDEKGPVEAGNGTGKDEKGPVEPESVSAEAENGSFEGEDSVEVPRGRRGRRWMIWTVGAVVVVFIGVIATLNIMFPPEKLRELVVPRLEERVGRQVELEAVRLKLFPRLAVRLEGLSIANPPEFNPEPAMEFAAVELHVRFWPLLRKQMELRQVRLLNPVFRYQVLEDGASNFEGLGPGAGSEGEAAGGPTAQEEMPVGVEVAAAAFAIEDLLLRQGQIFYTDGRSGRGASMSLEGRLSAVPEAEARERIRSEGKLELGSILVLVPNVGADSFPLPDTEIEYEAMADLYGDSLELVRIATKVAGVPVAGSGTVYGLRGDRSIEVTMESGEFDIADFLVGLPEALQPKEIEAAGRAELLVRVSGPIGYGAMPELDGVLDVQDVRAAHLQHGRLLTDGAGQATFDAHSMSLPSFTGELLGRPFELQVAAENLRDPIVDGRLTGNFDLARLASMSVDPPQVEGLADVDVRFMGPVKEPGALELVGPVDLFLVHYQSPSLAVPANMDTVRIQLTGTGVAAEEVSIELGDSDLTLSFTGDSLLQVLLSRDTAARPLVEFTARSQRLDWSELKADTTTVGYGQLVAARLAGRSLDGRDPGEIGRERYPVPELPPVTARGRVQIGEFLNQPTRAENVSFNMVLQDGVLTVEELDGQVFGGQLTGGLSFDLSQGEPPFPLAYDLTLTAAEAGSVVSNWTRLGSVMSGVVDFNIEGTTPIEEGMLPAAEAIAAAGRATFSEGRFAGFGVTRALAERFKVDSDVVSTFKQLGGAFRIENGAFVLDEWEYSAEEWRAGISGSAGLGGTLDLRLATEMPPSMLDKASLLPGGSVLGGLVLELPEGEMLPVVVEVGGTVSDPALGIDTEALQAAMEESLEGASKDLLRRLFRRPPPD
jgi:hypothetical protein